MEHDPLSLRTEKNRQTACSLLSRSLFASNSLFGERCTTAILLSFLVSIGLGTFQNACAKENLIGLGKVSLISQIHFDSPIIPARPGAIDGGNPIEGLGRPDDPNPSRQSDYSSHSDQNASDSTDGGDAQTEENQGRNEAGGALSESSESSNEGAEAKNEGAEARTESTESKNGSDEARSESADSKHEFAEGQGESKDAYNEAAEARSDTTSERESESTEPSHSSHSIRKKTRALVPVLNSPQPGQTLRKGGFSNFAKEQAASQQLHDELYEAEKARLKAAAKKVDAKANAGKTDKADTNKTDQANASKTDKADTSKTDQASASKTGNTDSKIGKADANKAKKADAGKTNGDNETTTEASKTGSKASVSKTKDNVSGTAKDGNAPRKLSQADNTPPSKPSTSSRHPKQELIPPPPPFAVPIVSKSNDTPERKALDLITNKKYATAESKLQDLISKNPDNCHARYLLAVALVWQRKYDDAKKEYSYVIEHSTDEKLIDLATQGLHKL